MDCEFGNWQTLDSKYPFEWPYNVDVGRGEDEKCLYHLKKWGFYGSIPPKKARAPSTPSYYTLCETENRQVSSSVTSKKGLPLVTKFISVDPGDRHISQRSKELVDSDARSHAARVTRARQKAISSHDLAHSTTVGCREENLIAASQEISRNVNVKRDDITCFSGIHIPQSIHLYLNLLVPNLQGVYQIFHVNTIWDEGFLPHMAHESYHYISAATVQSIHDAYNDPYRNSQPSSQVLRYKADALRILRKDLDGGDISDSSLLAIMHFGLLEGRFWSPSQRDMHRRALGEIIRKKGGLAMIDEYVSRILIQLDFPIVMDTGCAPITGSITPRSQPPLCDVSFLLKDLPRGFQPLALANKLQPDVLFAIARTSRLREHWTQTQPSHLPPKPNTIFLLEQDTGTSLYSDFWHACPSLLSNQSVRNEVFLNREPDINNLVCLGIWLYAFLEFSSRPTWETMALWRSMSQWARKELSSKLARCIEVREKDEEKCLKWLLSVAVEAWSAPDGGLQGEGLLLRAFGKERFADWDYGDWGDTGDPFFKFTKTGCAKRV